MTIAKAILKGLGDEFDEYCGAFEDTVTALVFDPAFDGSEEYAEDFARTLFTWGHETYVIEELWLALTDYEKESFGWRSGRDVFDACLYGVEPTAPYYVWPGDGNNWFVARYEEVF